MVFFFFFFFFINLMCMRFCNTCKTLLISMTRLSFKHLLSTVYPSSKTKGHSDNLHIRFHYRDELLMDGKVRSTKILF